MVEADFRQSCISPNIFGIGVTTEYRYPRGQDETDRRELRPISKLYPRTHSKSNTPSTGSTQLSTGTTSSTLSPFPADSFSALDAPSSSQLLHRECPVKQHGPSLSFPDSGHPQQYSSLQIRGRIPTPMSSGSWRFISHKRPASSTDVSGRNLNPSARLGGSPCHEPSPTPSFVARLCASHGSQAPLRYPSGSHWDYPSAYLNGRTFLSPPASSPTSQMTRIPVLSARDTRSTVLRSVDYSSPSRFYGAPQTAKGFEQRSSFTGYSGSSSALLSQEPQPARTAGGSYPDAYPDSSQNNIFYNSVQMESPLCGSIQGADWQARPLKESKERKRTDSSRDFYNSSHSKADSSLVHDSVENERVDPPTEKHRNSRKLSRPPGRSNADFISFPTESKDIVGDNYSERTGRVRGKEAPKASDLQGTCSSHRNMMSLSNAVISSSDFATPPKDKGQRAQDRPGNSQPATINHRPHPSIRNSDPQFSSQLETEFIISTSTSNLIQQAVTGTAKSLSSLMMPNFTEYLTRVRNFSVFHSPPSALLFNVGPDLAVTPTGTPGSRKRPGTPEVEALMAAMTSLDCTRLLGELKQGGKKLLTQAADRITASRCRETLSKINDTPLHAKCPVSNSKPGSQELSPDAAAVSSPPRGVISEKIVSEPWPTSTNKLFKRMKSAGAQASNTIVSVIDMDTNEKPKAPVPSTRCMSSALSRSTMPVPCSSENSAPCSEKSPDRDQLPSNFNCEHFSILNSSLTRYSSPKIEPNPISTPIRVTLSSARALRQKTPSFVLSKRNAESVSDRGASESKSDEPAARGAPAMSVKLTPVCIKSTGTKVSSSESKDGLEFDSAARVEREKPSSPGELSEQVAGSSQWSDAVSERKKMPNRDISKSVASSTASTACEPFTTEVRNTDDRFTGVSIARHKLGGFKLMLDLPQSLMIPEGDLVIGEAISKGTFGTVHIAHWNGMKVAVKVSQLESASSDAAMRLEHLKNFEREVNAYVKLEHENIVKCYGVTVKETGFLAIVMEYVNRGNVFDLLFENRIEVSAAQRLKMARQLVSAVSYLHSRSPKVVHRDLKTPNLILDESYNLKLCDFGKTKFMAGTVLVLEDNGGSPRYMAPECFVPNGVISEKADIWSLACCLIEIFGGPIPYERYYDNSRVIERILTYGEPPMVPHWFMRKLYQILKRAFSFDPEIRPNVTDIQTVLLTLEPRDLEINKMDRRRAK